MKVQKILYPTDFSECSEQALDHALFLARELGAELHMLHAVVLHGDDPHDPQVHFSEFSDLLQRLSAVAASELSRLAEHPRGEGLTIHQVEKRGYSAASVILEHAEEIEADVIVMGTHGRRGPGHFFLGSVAEHVVRYSTCPVLTLRQQKQPRALEAIRHILVPVDFSDYSKEGIETAKELALLCHAELQLVHVIEVRKLPPFYAPLDIAEVIENRKRTSAATLQELADKDVGAAVEVELHVLEGPTAAHAITDFAGAHASDLIVIPSHGLTGIERILLGSVAERVIRLAKCPVFTVKPFGTSLSDEE
jgi:nucleotide-binding universal stress UspA family protein